MTMKCISDEGSVGSEAHIFFDDSSSSISDTSSSIVDATKPATPHIFLAYAKKSAQNSDILKQLQSSAPRAERRVLNDIAKPTNALPFRRWDSTPTAHIFLPYAGNSPSDQKEDDECMETQAGEGTCETTDCKLLLDWGGSMDSFRSSCKYYMTTEHHLPPDWAGLVATAMRAAATRTIPDNLMSSKHQYSRLAEFIENILSESWTNGKETKEYAKGECQSIRKSVENSSNESMLRMCERQQEELSFLRLAMKHLILPPKASIAPEEKTQSLPFTTLNSQRSSPFHQLTGCHHYRDNFDDKLIRGREGNGIPSFIELRAHLGGPPVVDTDLDTLDLDTLEVASQLTPSLGDFDSPFQVQEYNLYLLADGRGSYAGLSRMQATAVPWHVNIPSQTPAPIGTREMRSASRTRSELTSHGPRSCCLSLSRGIGTEEPPQQIYDRESSVADLAKGEIRDHRARNVDFSIRMNSVTKLLKGQYSGKIRINTGLPHGPGVFRFENRDLYIGEFQSGMFHGIGTLFTRRNRNLIKLRGTFHHNEFVGDNLLLQDEAFSIGVSV